MDYHVYERLHLNTHLRICIQAIKMSNLVVYGNNFNKMVCDLSASLIIHLYQTLRFSGFRP